MFIFRIIAFSALQNTENEYNETLNKKYKTDNFFKIRIIYFFTFHLLITMQK